MWRPNGWPSCRTRTTWTATLTICRTDNPGERSRSRPSRSRHRALYPDTSVCLVGVVLVTESPAGVGEQAARARPAGVVAGGAQGSAEDRSSCAVGSGALVAAGPGGREPAADAEPGQGGAPLLGARGVIVGILIVWRWRRRVRPARDRDPAPARLIIRGLASCVGAAPTEPRLVASAGDVLARPQRR